MEWGELENYIDICVKLEYKLLHEQFGSQYNPKDKENDILDEVRQVAALGILQAEPKYDPNKGKPQTFFVNYGKWAIGQWAFKQKRYDLREIYAEDSESGDDTDGTAEEQMDLYASQRRSDDADDLDLPTIKEILKPLTPKQRECAAMLMEDEQDRDNIADLIGTQRQAISIRMRTARKRFVKYYGHSNGYKLKIRTRGSD